MAASVSPATTYPIPTPTDSDHSFRENISLKHNASVTFADAQSYSKGRAISNDSSSSKHESLGASIRSGIVKHQLGISINFILLVMLAHTCFPRIRQTTQAFYQLSYYDPESGRYMQGGRDFCFVLSWIFIFTGLRAAALDHVFLPLAKSWGITKPKTRVRFAEQSWGLVYATCSFSYGMYLMKHSKYWFNFYEMWTSFPTYSLDGLMKFYYLVQLAFWIQQLVVVNIEERRKDYTQMFTHHIITSTLIFASYTYYQTKVGNAILCAMDVADIFLPSAKLLKYLGYQTACDFAFAAFITAWIVSRHIWYTMICWSVYFDMPTATPTACYNDRGEQVSDAGINHIFSNVFHPYVNPGGPVCFNSQIQLSFLGLLTFLHGILMTWLVTILKIAWKVIRGQGAEDQRSDASDDDVADLEEFKDEEVNPHTLITGHPGEAVVDVELAPFEEEVGVESLSFRKRTGSPLYRKSGSSTGALAEKKELLRRIGCDKPID